MKKLIIVRHGSYTDASLNSIGIAQMKRLGETIRNQHLNGGPVQILTSTAPRAVQSAAILGEIIASELEQHELLWSDDAHDYNIKAALELISRYEGTAEIALVVTHLEYAEYLPYYYGRDVLGVTTFPREEILKGSAWVIDCEAKTCRLIDNRN